MERSYQKNKTEKIIISLIVAVLIILFDVLVSLISRLTTTEHLIMSWILTTLYALFAFIYIEPLQLNVNKIIEKPIYKQIPVEIVVEKPIIKEVPVYIQIPIENKVIEVVEKPIKEAVFIDKKTLEIKDYDYLGSLIAKKYHTKDCKFKDLIKNRFKIENDDKDYFISRNFKPCKECILKH